jgi:FkbM family methyltransferase
VTLDSNRSSRPQSAGRIARYTGQLGRSVYLRSGTSDEQGWHDVFDPDRAFHVPPAEMPTPRTVLDLGANIGLTAAHYRALWPEAVIVAVEMDRENAGLARRNFNGIVFQKAVSGWGGRQAYDPSVSADAYALGPVAGDLHERTVWTMGLLSLVVAFFGDAPVDFVKMDVEGSEWEMLEAAAQGWWPSHMQHLLVEFHDEPRDGPKIVARGVEALEAIGYDARHHEVHPQAVWAVRR